MKIVIILLVVLSTVMFGCIADQTIVGSWIRTDVKDDGKDVELLSVVRIEFLDNGVYINEPGEDKVEGSGKWKTYSFDDSLLLISRIDSVETKYLIKSLSEKELVLSRLGRITTFERMDKKLSELNAQ